MSGEESGSTASGNMWLAVMNNEIAKHHNQGDRKWRQVANGAPVCEVCKESDGTVMLCCAQDKCSRYFHVDCAFHQGGLELDNDGILTVYCDSHIKPLLFCSCKEKYDEKRPMVYCDECCDWFHNSCEGLSANETRDMEKYTCKSCRSIKKQGRTVPQATKDKNYAKDCRSAYQGSASKAIGLLSELEGGLCPIIDEISSPSKSNYSVHQILEALTVLSASPFMSQADRISNGAAAENSMGDLPAEELLETVGVMGLISVWRERLTLYLQEYQRWDGKASEFFQRAVNEFTCSLAATQIPIWQEYCNTIRTLEEEALSKLVGIPIDFDGFYAFSDAIVWIQDFLATLHQQPKSELWTNQVSASLRTGNAKARLLSSYPKSTFCGRSFVDFFQKFLKDASQCLSSMNNWYNQSYKILNSRDVEYQLVSLQEFLNSADEYPVRPVLYEDLQEIIADANELEGLISSALSDDTSTRELLEELNTKKAELGNVELPSDAKLDAVIERMVFMKALEILSDEGRVQAEIVQSLYEQAGALTTTTTTTTTTATATATTTTKSVLRQKIDGEIEAAAVQLKGMLDEAAGAVASLDAALIAEGVSRTAAGSAREDAIKVLQQLKLITPQEELLVFLEETAVLLTEAAPFLNHDQQQQLQDKEEVSSASHRPTLTDVQELLERMQATAANAIADQFPTAAAPKAALNRHLGVLFDLESEARSLWSLVNSAVSDCAQGRPVTAEELRRALTAAQAGRLSDPEGEKAAQSLLQQAEEVAERCAATLKTITDASDTSVRQAAELVQAIRHLPVPGRIVDAVLQRHRVCACVQTSQKLLNHHHHHQEQQATTACLPEEDMRTLRDMNSTILRLSEAVQEDPELSLLNGVAEPVKLYHWQQEVCFLRAHPQGVSLAAAAQILQNAEELGEAARNSNEWSLLHAELSKAQEVTRQAEALLELLEEAKISASGADLLGQDELVPAQLPVWSSTIHPLQQQLVECMQQEQALKIRDAAVSQRLRSAFDLLALVDRVHSKLSAARATMDGQPPMEVEPAAAEGGGDGRGSSISSSGSSVPPPGMDFREVTTFANQLSVALEQEQQRHRQQQSLPSPSSSASTNATAPSSPFPLLEALVEDVNELYKAASEWNERASKLLPQKATRHKVRPLDGSGGAGVSSKEDLLQVMSEPISRAVLMPMHERLLSCLHSADMFRASLVSFLLCEGDQKKKHKKEKDGDETAGTTKMDVEEEEEEEEDEETFYQSNAFQDRLQDDKVLLTRLKEMVDVIPLELPEGRVLVWVSGMFEWIDSIPYPRDDPKVNSVPLDFALRKVEEAKPLVAEILQSIISCLQDMGVLNLDPAAGPEGFHPHAHPNLHRAGELLKHLEDQLQNTEELQARISQAIIAKRPKLELLDLQNELGSMLVQPAPSARKALERALLKSSSSSGSNSTGKRGGAVHKSSLVIVDGEDGDNVSEEEYFDADADGSDDDNYWATSYTEDRKAMTATTTAGGKRSKSGVDSLVNIKKAQRDDKQQGKLPKKASSGGARGTAATGTSSAGSKILCASSECENPLTHTRLEQSAFCSAKCALASASSLLSALLRYRKLLSIYDHHRRHQQAVIDPMQELSRVSAADWQAFATQQAAGVGSGAPLLKTSSSSSSSPPTAAATSSSTGGNSSLGLDAAMREIHQGLQAAGYVLGTGEAAAGAGGGAGGAVTSNHSSDRHLAHVHRLLSALPVAAGAVFLRGNQQELLAHNAAFGAAGAVPPSPAPSPRNPTASSSGGSSSSSADEDLRLMVRYGAEELFVKTLTKLKVPGAISHGAFIALDFEHELFRKYCPSSSTALDKKEYRKHYMMLSANLKKSHNDPLVERLVTSDLTIEQLLELTAQQLADASTQQRRQQKLHEIAKDSIRESTVEALEARRREVMATGGGDGDRDAARHRAGGMPVEGGRHSAAAGDSAATASGLDVADGGGGGGLMMLDSADLDGDIAMKLEAAATEAAAAAEAERASSSAAAAAASAQGTGSGFRHATEIEQSVNGARSNGASASSSSSDRKRPLDADAITRFTSTTSNSSSGSDHSNSGKSKHKHARTMQIDAISAEGQSATGATAASSTPRGGVGESPRNKAAPPSLLGNILAHKSNSSSSSGGGGGSAGDGAAEHYEALASATSRNKPLAASTQGVLGSILSKAVKLINNEGNHEVAFVRPAGKSLVMKGEAWINDSQLQGILKSTCNIDGRVKIAEFKRIITKLQAMLNDARALNNPHRKLISVFRMVVVGAAVKGSAAAASYEQFCGEFSRDQRVGLSNLGGSGSGAQAYVLPPALKDCLPLFSCFDHIAEGQSNPATDALLYGVLTSKESGPAKYVQSSGGFSSSSLLSNTTTTSSSSSSSSSSNSASSVPPPPPPPPARSVAALPPPVAPSVPKPVAPPAAPAPAPASAPASVVPAPPPAPAASATATAATPTQQQQDPIKRVATFCAARGVQMIRDLQAKPETKTVMPFLFEGHPDHPRFLAALKQELAATKK